MTDLIRKKNGYSLIVLIITIIVIIILALVSITSLRASRKKTEATNFIFDLRAVEEAVRNFYMSKGTLPISSNEELNIYDVASNNGIPGLLSQLSNEDDDVYYLVDLSQLQSIAIKDTSRGYIVNRGSQNIYVTTPLEYQKEGEDSEQQYFTLTADLVNGRLLYSAVEEDIEIVGNPINWASKADLRMVLPKRSLTETNWNGWTFKYSIGPKTIEEMEADDPQVSEFQYGDMLTVTTNGTYTFYVKEPASGGEEGKITIKNLNVSMIDDIKPKYEFLDSGEKFLAIDNETGIKAIKYKTLTNFKNNTQEALNSTDEYIEARTNIDFFLIDGEGKDLIYELKNDISDYIAQRKSINDAINNEQVNFERWLADHPLDNLLVYQEDIDRETNRHNTVDRELREQLIELNQKYSYLYDIDGNTDDSRLVIYIKDNSGNALVVGDSDKLTTRILAKSYNISLSGLE